MPRKSSSAASPSMAALAAAAAAGEGADAAGAGGMVPPSGEEDKKPQMAPAASVGASNSSAALVAVRKGVVGGRPICKVERCGADLADAGRYNRRHKVCEPHSKAPVVLVAGLRQRFCQQCSRFHELSEFDDQKRSCRRCLVGHNERRRRAPPPAAD